MLPTSWEVESLHLTSGAPLWSNWKTEMLFKYYHSFRAACIDGVNKKNVTDVQSDYQAQLINRHSLFFWQACGIDTWASDIPVRIASNFPTSGSTSRTKKNISCGPGTYNLRETNGVLV